MFEANEDTRANRPVNDVNDHINRGKSIKLSLVGSAALFVISLVVGLNVPPGFSNDTLADFRDTLGPLASLGPLALIFIIFLNNALKALGAVILGIVLGLPPIIFLVFNGLIIGVVIGGMKSITGYGVIAASLIPHGIIEIPALVLSTALGLMIGMESLKYIIKRKSMVRTQLRYGLKVYLKWILIGLFIAAIIEVFITPQFVLWAGGEELLTQ